MDLLKPIYNILKTAGSVMNLKWTLKSREKFRLSIINNKDRISKFRALHLGKKVSEETRELMRKAALNRIVSGETRLKMSKNNAKSVKFTAYINGIFLNNLLLLLMQLISFFKIERKEVKLKQPWLNILYF